MATLTITGMGMDTVGVERGRQQEEREASPALFFLIVGPERFMAEKG